MIEPRISEGIAVVTGASSGIGEAASMQLSAAGFHLVLIARRQDRLEKIRLNIRESGGSADVICSDLSQEGSYAAIADQVKNIGAPIEVLLNNAGFGWYGFGDEMPRFDCRQYSQPGGSALRSNQSISRWLYNFALSRTCEHRSQCERGPNRSGQDALL
jgi:NADP-dependent 3-hydroxy acid dehydrogenase YdfG